MSHGICSYQVNTGAGFLVPRRAILSLSQVGNALQGLVAVTTEKRWGIGGKKGLEETLRTIAESFRVYRLNSGIFASSSLL